MSMLPSTCYVGGRPNSKIKQAVTDLRCVFISLSASQQPGPLRVAKGWALLASTDCSEAMFKNVLPAHDSQTQSKKRAANKHKS